jgi:hypothetical protein
MTTERPPRKYRSLIGTAFAHSGVMYDDHPANFNNAVSRHFKLREPDEGVELACFQTFGSSLTFDEFLMHQTLVYHVTNCDDWCSQCWKQIGHHEYNESVQTAAEIVANEEHAKKKARLNSLLKINLNGNIAKDLPNDVVSWILKVLEIAKRKGSLWAPARIVVNCSTENSLARVCFANSFKKHFGDKWITYGKVSIFCTTSTKDTAILDCFMKVLSGINEYLIINYSDDAMAMKNSEPVEQGDIDIVNNDSSHSCHTFEDYFKISDMPEDSRANLRKLFTNEFVIVNPFTKNKRKTREAFKFHMINGYLPTGIGDTYTCNSLIYNKVGERLNHYSSFSTSLFVNLTMAGLSVGFRISYSPVFDRRKMQFLKNSPNANFTLAIPNLGIMLRYSGWCECDLPRAVRDYASSHQLDPQKYYQSLLTYGFFSRFLYPPLLPLCPYYIHLASGTIKHIDIIDWIITPVTDQQVLITLDDVYGRYFSSGLTLIHIQEFEQLIRDTKAPCIIYCELIRIVLKLDYGL